MAEKSSASAGFSKPRSVFGDITNSVGKRGVSEGQNTGSRSSDYDKFDSVALGKGSHLSIRQCTDLNSSEDNDKNEANMLGFAAASETSKSSYGHCNDSGRFGHDNPSDGSGLPKIGGFVEKKRKEGNFMGFEGEIGDKSVPNKPNLSKGSLYLKNKRPRLDHAVGEKIIDLELCLGETMVGCSSKQKDLYLPELGTDETMTVSEKDNGLPTLQKDGNYADKLVLSQSGPADCTFFSESQESRVVELGGQVGNDSANVCKKTEAIKNCGCSFCTKAGYMLLDLNYQDFRARVTATRKIQKEANILAEKNCRSSKAAGNSTNELESQLMHQWRSLFQHMASVCEQESNDLEARLLSLSDWKEKCKTQMLSSATDKH